MSKLIFSTLSILALLLSGTNCSTGIRGGGGRGIQSCEVGLKLNPRDECRGSDYSLRNNAGRLTWEGPYIESCHTHIYVGGDIKSKNFVVFNGRAFSFSDSTGGRFICDDLLLARNGNAWTIERLPPPATTVR